MDENILLQLRFDKLKDEYKGVQKKYKNTIIAMVFMFIIMVVLEILLLCGLSFSGEGKIVLSDLAFGLLIASLIQYLSTLNCLDQYKSDLRTTIFELFREMNSKGIAKLVDENQEFIKEIKII